MITHKYKGYIIEKYAPIDNRLRRYDVYRVHDKDSVFPTKQHVARTQTLKSAKDWINKEVAK